MIEYYTKNKKTYSYVVHPMDEEDVQIHKRKISYRLRKQEQEDYDKYVEEHKPGYCQRCNCLKALNGVCPICGE